MVTIQKINSYHGLNSCHSFIYDKNDFSGIPINKSHHLRHLSLNDLSFNDYSFKKFKNRKRNNSNKFSDFTKIFEKTFTISDKNIFDALNSIKEKKIYNKVQPANNINTISNQENKRSKSTLNKYKSGINSTININLNNSNKNKIIRPKEYVNKNFYKVFGKNNDKTYRIFHQISQIKNNLSPKIIKRNLINRPKIEVRNSKIINEYIKNTIPIHRKINNLLKTHKRNLSYLDIYNNNTILNNNSFLTKNTIKNSNNYKNENNKKRVNSNTNYINYKNNIVQFAYIDLINDNYDEPKKDIEIYKKSFERNKSKDFIVQKYLNVSKKKND